MKRPRIAFALGAFYPGNEASGPNQSFCNLIAELGDRYEFTLLTRDRPFGSARPAQVEHVDANFAGVAKALYLRPAPRGTAQLIGFLRQEKPDLLWLNGLFDRDFTLPLLIARRVGLLPPMRFLLSPRGECFQAALEQKSWRKRAFLHMANLAGLHRNLIFHAANEAEKEAISLALHRPEQISIAPNLKQLPDFSAHLPTREQGNALQLVFLGRITPIKGLDLALKYLAQVAFPVVFHVIGPVEDPIHWQHCQRLLSCLPVHVSIRSYGALSHRQSMSLLQNCDLLFLPSRSESFGHAIFEALSHGVPALISDQTPWTDLEQKQAGFALPLDQPERFIAALDGFAALSPTERNLRRKSARRLAEQRHRSDAGRSMTIAMLDHVLAT